MKLGIMGLSPGNGHPYSWAAIFNGYDKEKMADCPFEVIPAYLAEEKPEAFGIEDAKVTHIWTQDRKTSEHVAGAALIENIVDKPEDMIGQVDGVLLARDDGENHLLHAKSFIEADVPLFIDKPLSDNLEDLREFIKYYEAGKKFLSCSSMRFAPAVQAVAADKSLGEIIHANATIGKYWRTYGIHIIEAVTAVMGDDIETVQNVGRPESEIVHLTFSGNRHATLQTFKRFKSAFNLSFFGDEKGTVVNTSNAFLGFKRTLASFVKYMKTDEPPFPWSHTVITSQVVVAGRISMAEDGRVVRLSEVK